MQRQSTRRRCALLVVAFASLHVAWPAAAQLLDRVLARVGTTAITLTDVQAARGLGLVDVTDGADAERSALQQLIDRQLILNEVARFPPPEPAAAALQAETERLRAAAGGRLAELMRSTGLDEKRLGDIARDSLRIQAYLAQRFGTVQVSDLDVQDYFRQHAADFTRNGRPLTFDEAAPVARERAAEERRRGTIAKWLGDLRSRAEIVEVAAK